MSKKVLSFAFLLILVAASRNCMAQSVANVDQSFLMGSRQTLSESNNISQGLAANRKNVFSTVSDQLKSARNAGSPGKLCVEDGGRSGGLHDLPDAKRDTTRFGGGAGEFATMLRQLEEHMINYQKKWKDTLGGKVRNVFVPWIRDHVHVSKAMKYMHSDMTSFLEWFLENQTAEGLFFDYYMPLEYSGSGDRKNIFNERYWKVFPDDNIQMHRLPVEADLEYLMVEGVYAIWQSTGDSAFVKKWLPALVKGMEYSMKDPLRWSKKYQLVKRGYTLDTWDFMQLPSSREEFKRKGGDIQKAIFDIDESTPMGIMHGDNSGMYAACRQLATMCFALGHHDAANEWQRKAEGFRKRTNDLCWNGKFYAHFVPVDPMPPYLKMDQRNTLSLSNPYDINRGLPTAEMAQSIISSYLDLKERNKAHSFAEWYGIYPAVQPHFADYKPGSYMNGGVNTIVAGELAKAAFKNGFEEYGVDILHRLIQLMEKFQGDLPVSYTPEGKVDEGIPDNWGQAAVYDALIEGLAGVVDRGVQFSNLELSPRWLSAGKDSADVSVSYGPTGKRIRYKFVHDPLKKSISFEAQTPAEVCIVNILLPSGASRVHASVNDITVESDFKKCRDSRYAVINVASTGNFSLTLHYE